jgi:hypothetical protein
MVHCRIIIHQKNILGDSHGVNCRLCNIKMAARKPPHK